MFAQESIILETPFSKGIIFKNAAISKASGDFIPDQKEALAFEKALQEGILEIKAGDSATLTLPKHILAADFSEYYRMYKGLDSGRIQKRILVVFIPKNKIENINDLETWHKLIGTKEQFSISYFIADDKIFCHPKREE